MTERRMIAYLQDQDRPGWKLIDHCLDQIFDFPRSPCFESLEPR